MNPSTFTFIINGFVTRLRISIAVVSKVEGLGANPFFVILFSCFKKISNEKKFRKMDLLIYSSFR